MTVAIKNHGKVFDATVDELSALKRLNNVVELEYRYGDKEPESVYCTEAEFAKLVSAEQLEKFDNNRGRRSGFSPGTRNGS
ncbi:hypothetical protein ACWFRF_15635 [Nocardia sp. NPDC055165]